MKLPIIFLIDDDPQVLRAIQRDVKTKYREEYRVLASDSPQEALSLLKELKVKNEDVAIFVSDQRMPQMEGVEFLDAAKDLYPKAKRILLTAYSDTSAAIKAINDVKLDYYLMKPWDPPDERLFPVMNDLLYDWHSGFKPKFEGIKLIGFQWSPKSHQIKDFLLGNLIPYQWLDVEANSEAKEFLKSLNATTSELPIIIYEDGTHKSQPTIYDIAGKIGLKSKATEQLYDVVIIGAGPAGLAASVYGASEGLKTLLIEKHAPGGQAGTSSRIENYLGFPSGVSGSELTRRAMTQAVRFGTEVLTPQEVKKIILSAGSKTIILSDDSEIHTKALVLTTGVSYRTLDIPGINHLLGAGVYYGSVSTEAHSVHNLPVYIIGGGNSAGQAAMYLSQFASDVNIVIRGESVYTTMSSYLCEQIKLTPNIKIVSTTVVEEVKGESKLEEVVLLDLKNNKRDTVPAAAMFIFIGAKPNTDWFPKEILKDQKGFILTGRDLIYEEKFHGVWKLNREPFLLETSVPGIFSAGDVRSTAIARVASAVGEGAMAIKFVHEYLAEI